MAMHKVWRALFWAAALYNFAAGLPSLLAPAASMANQGLPPLDPQHVILAQLTGMLIAVFGIGYAMVAMGRPGAREIVFLGLLGKVGVCVILALRLREVAVPPAMIWATAGDFLFILAFAAYLVRTRPGSV
jgi:predicted membrane channel-forming protein YqfA (hemolysin III family)